MAKFPTFSCQSSCHTGGSDCDTKARDGNSRYSEGDGTGHHWHHEGGRLCHHDHASYTHQAEHLITKIFQIFDHIHMVWLVVVSLL